MPLLESIKCSFGTLHGLPSGPNGGLNAIFLSKLIIKMQNIYRQRKLYPDSIKKVTDSDD